MNKLLLLLICIISVSYGCQDSTKDDCIDKFNDCQEESAFTENDEYTQQEKCLDYYTTCLDELDKEELK